MEKELNQNSLGGKSIKRILGSYGIVFVLIALIVIFTILSNRFLTADNIFNILRQVSIVGIIEMCIRDRERPSLRSAAGRM